MTAPLPRRPGPTARVRVTELDGGRVRRHEDRVAVEEPLELRLAAPGTPVRRLGITMRTPGHDFELAAGWVIHEGIAERGALRSVRYCTDADLRPDQEFNVVTIELDRQPLRLPEARLLSSACGVCGSDMIAEVVAPAGRPETTIDRDVLISLPDRLREHQPGFSRTGGLHAAGLAGVDGTLAAVREDVGRHNAVDKVVGSFLLRQEAVPPVLVLSGRIGFELVQKAVVAGVLIIVAVGAPSSLAIDLAERAGLTVAGFTRGARAVVHTGAERVLGV